MNTRWTAHTREHILLRLQSASLRASGVRLANINRNERFSDTISREKRIKHSFYVEYISPDVWRFSKTLTLILLTSRIWWAPNNASKWQMGFNSAFKGLNEVLFPQYGNFWIKFNYILRWRSLSTPLFLPRL